MNPRNSIFVFLTALFYFSKSLAALQAPIGHWITMDDKTGEKRAIISISETGGVLSGVIDKVFPKPGDTGVCHQCPGAFKDKKIAGLRFLWGLKKEGDNEWSGGSILDPKTGKIYRAKITVQGDKLLVRGYIGVSLLGRTQIWHKE